MEYEKTYVSQTYDNIANHFDHTRHYKWEWVTTFVNSHDKESLIYDVACGNGRNMNYSGYNFIGVDNCKKFLDICNKKGYNCLESDMCSLPFKNKTCDGLMCIASFHHLENKKRRLQA